MSINYNKNSIECRKFKPNIFNKNKCSDCFKDCLEHSKSALDNCRASRKVFKCGYLFVAPDWDFTNPLYRTKKWQRRWFILYDDGELTYSIDEQPDTVPQAKINMNQVIEVNFADEITGQLNSIAIKSVDHVTYLKANCSEESKWWYNILHSFPNARNRIKQQNLLHSSFMQSSKSQQVQNKQSMLIENVSHSEKLQEITNIITNKSKNIVSRWSDAQYDEKPDQRGDPDGGDCNLDGELSLLLVDNAELESHDILNSKRGWLMKLNPINNVWSKYWFCLKGGGLYYYRDPTAEKRGVLDGILDVNSLTEIKEIFSTRENSFQLKTYDNKKIVLSASTEKIKYKWIATIELAAGLTVTISTENILTTPSSTTLTILGANNNNNLCQTCDEKPITSNNNNNNVLLESNNSQVKSISKFSANECLKTKKTKNVNMEKKSNNIELSENNHNNNKNKELKVERKKTKQSSLKIESTNKDIAISSDDEYKTASSSNSNSAELNRLYMLSTTKPKENNLVVHQEKNEMNDDEIDGKKIHRFDSFSDLTSLSDIDPKTLSKTNLVDEYDELKQRFAKLVNELKTMKRELRDSYSSYDSLDIAYTALKQEFERKRIESNSRIKMMADRIQDLATKYSNAEKQLRVLKQKLIKSERKRTLSLKGKDTIQKEVEVKVHELEEKIDCVDGEILSPTIGSLRASPARGSTPERKTSNYKHRRKSLESVSNQPFQLLVRLNALEKRIENTSSSSSSLTTKQNEDHIKQLENTIIMCKNTIEQGISQFQMKSSRNSDTTELIKILVKSLLDANKYLTDGNGNNSEISPVNNDIEIFDQNPVKIALQQLESQLTTKLGDLLKQRRLLRETNQLTCKKDLELLAERIAFESVCFGKLRESLNRSETPENFAEHHVKGEVSEISQLMVTLKSKLCGKPFKKINSSFDILSNVLAKRLFLTSEILAQDGLHHSANPTIEADSNIVEDLMRQQHELNVIVKRYKSTTIDNLAYDLAIDAINYISTNDAIQSVVQDTWRQAQETVSAELIQSEISQVMMKTAKRYEESIGPSTGFAITHQERMNFEVLADMVQTMLRHEMEVAAGQLTQCFQETLEKIKQGQWRTHLGDERRISEGRQILVEFADVIAHKTLIDARIAFIRGEHSSSNVDIKEEKCQEKLNLNCLAKYENLFSELSDDLSVNNADEVLLEADFNFFFHQFTAQFSLDKQDLNDLSNVIMKLEDTIIKLHNKLNPEANINQIQNLNLENIKNITIKLNQFHEILESVLDQATIQCNECEKMQDAIIDMSQQHDDELNELNQKNSTMHVEIEGLLERIRELGRDKTELADKLSNEINIVKIHEKEIQDLKPKLKILERNCQNKSVENEELAKKLNDTNGDLLTVKKTVETLVQNLQKEQKKMQEVAQDYENLIQQVHKERESTKELENQLEMVEFEYKSKVDQLNQYYQKKIAIELENKSMKEQEEEKLCQKYQEEIEHLRILCEKGLNAMENSHKKIIAELEERHQEEIQRMLAEKETALAEETQATLYALDAMRKVHQNEVQKEVERFKQEFIFHFNNNHKHLDTITLQKEKELEEVRQEILSLSEKYSMKCVETISLEEKLKQMEQKLKVAELFMHKNNDDREKTISTKLEFPRGYGMSSISKSQSSKVSIDETITTSSRATNASNSKDDDAIIKSFELEI